MQEKIYDEFSKPEWIKVEVEYYFKLQDKLDKYETTINEIKELIEELENEINR